MTNHKPQVDDEREQAKPPAARSEEAAQSKSGASPTVARKRTEKFEVEAVTQEQEGGSLASDPEP
jgi:hypothetical protein